MIFPFINVYLSKKWNDDDNNVVSMMNPIQIVP